MATATRAVAATKTSKLYDFLCVHGNLFHMSTTPISARRLKIAKEFMKYRSRLSISHHRRHVCPPLECCVVDFNQTHSLNSRDSLFFQARLKWIIFLSTKCAHKFEIFAIKWVSLMKSWLLSKSITKISFLDLQRHTQGEILILAFHGKCLFWIFFNLR